MKKLIATLLSFLALCVSASFSEEKYRIDGKSYCKQSVGRGITL